MYFVCITDCQLYKTPRELLLQFIKNNPEVLFEVANTLSNRLFEFLSKIEGLVFGNAKYRLISTLLYLSANFGKKTEDGILIKYWFTHQDIGNLSSISREQVSRELAELSKKNIIAYKNRLLLIKDVKKLQSLVGN